LHEASFLPERIISSIDFTEARSTLLKRALISLAGILAIGGGMTAYVPAATTAKAAPRDACLAKASKWERLQCENFTHSAPGDEYFGKMKLSYLGINNTFHDETIRAGDYTTDSNIINKVSFADDALRAWASRYPGDPQLARSYYLAIVMFKKIYVQSYQDKAWAYMHTLTSRFGSTYFGKLEKADLARGFTEHYFADPQPCPTPLPSGVLPQDLATPAATPTPSPAPGRPKVQIIVPPCVSPSPPPTAAPELTPQITPTSTPTP